MRSSTSLQHFQYDRNDIPNRFGYRPPINFTKHFKTSIFVIFGVSIIDPRILDVRPVERSHPFLRLDSQYRTNSQNIFQLCRLIYRLPRLPPSSHDSMTRCPRWLDDSVLVGLLAAFARSQLTAILFIFIGLQGSAPNSVEIMILTNILLDSTWLLFDRFS